MLIDKVAIESFIPQRCPFVMIDELIESTAHTFQSQFVIQKDNLFLIDGQLSDVALIENIAQTCAAGLEYQHRKTTSGKTQTTRLGFIGAVSQLEVKNRAKEGQKITTYVNLVTEFDSIFLLHGRVFYLQELLLSCQLKVVLQQ